MQDTKAQSFSFKHEFIKIAVIFSLIVLFPLGAIGYLAGFTISTTIYVIYSYGCFLWFLFVLCYLVYYFLRHVYFTNDIGFEFLALNESVKLPFSTKLKVLDLKPSEGMCLFEITDLDKKKTKKAWIEKGHHGQKNTFNIFDCIVTRFINIFFY